MNILIYELPGNLKSYIRYKMDRKRFNLFPYAQFIGPRHIAYRASRIWEWDTETDTVWYIKHRQAGITMPVDRKEFFLVQLKAEDWKRETA